MKKLEDVKGIDPLTTRRALCFRKTPCRLYFFRNTHLLGRGTAPFGQSTSVQVRNSSSCFSLDLIAFSHSGQSSRPFASWTVLGSSVPKMA